MTREAYLQEAPNAERRAPVTNCAGADDDEHDAYSIAL